jgi:tRNA 2-thiouridine synthesizing protein A
MTNYDQELDASGLDCPLPILRTKKALSSMDTGQVLHVITTDPGAAKDFRVFCKQTGNELLEFHEDDDCFQFVIKKG